jgi:truncated hemoglobin YjbI
MIRRHAHRDHAHQTVTTQARAEWSRDLARTLAAYQVAAAARDYESMAHLEQRARALSRAARHAVA